MRSILHLFCLVILTSQLSAQTWLTSGDDYVADTTYFNSLSDISIDSMAERIVISLSNLDIITGEVEYITQAYSRSNGVLAELGGPIIGDQNEDTEVNSIKLNAKGNTLIIGRSSFDYQDINLSGRIEVHELDENNTWIEKGNPIGGYGIAAGFGKSVAISNDGNTIIAGGDEAIFGGTGGYVRVFDWDGTEWIQKGDSIRMQIAYTGFGSSVNMSKDGNIIAVGAREERDTINDLFDAGSVTLFNWDGINWQQMGQKFYGLNESEKLGRKHGFSLSNDGFTLVIGNRKSNNEEGEVNIYHWDSNQAEWVQKGNTLLGEFNRFGDGVNISGNGNTISVTGDYGIQMFNYKSASQTWELIGNKINEPTANVGYGFLNHDGSILSTPGSIQIPEYTFFFSSLVRFYELDENILSLNQIEENNLTSIYPNPAHHEINVDFSEENNYHLILSDLLGNIIYTYQTNKANNVLELKNYPKGVYFLSVVNNSKVISQEKFIIQN